MIEDRVLTRTVQRWCEESKTWIDEEERVMIEVRWPASGIPVSAGSWKLQSRSFGVLQGHYTCNGSDKGCESARFGGCSHCDPRD